MAKGWLVGGAVFLGAILVASIVVALLESNEPLPTGTPEATVQLFLEAVEDDNIELAYTVLSTDLMVECAVDEFFGTAGWPGDRLRGDRITLEDVTTVSDTTFVTVRMTNLHGTGPFGTSESSFDQRFSLRQEEGQWRFTEYPWPFSRCGPFKPIPERPVIQRPAIPTVTPVP